MKYKYKQQKNKGKKIMIKMCEIKDICKSHFLLLRVYILTFNQTYDKTSL
ncbi:hypothetical protein HC081234_14720 [Helicobacter cinaedi]|nr:hypothetical protein HC081234_14720 [Helicobacter cinaedi]